MLHVRVIPFADFPLWYCASRAKRLFPKARNLPAPTCNPKSCNDQNLIRARANCRTACCIAGAGWCMLRLLRCQVYTVPGPAPASNGGVRSPQGQSGPVWVVRGGLGGGGGKRAPTDCQGPTGHCLHCATCPLSQRRNRGRLGGSGQGKRGGLHMREPNRPLPRSPPGPHPSGARATFSTLPQQHASFRGCLARWLPTHRVECTGPVTAGKAGGGGGGSRPAAPPCPQQQQTTTTKQR